MPTEGAERPAGRPRAGRWGHVYGPLPLWAWAGLGLAGALTYSLWRKNKTAKQAPSTNQASTVSTDQTPPYVVINDLYTGTTTTPVPVAGPPVSGTGDKDKDKDGDKDKGKGGGPTTTPVPTPVPTPQPVPVTDPRIPPPNLPQPPTYAPLPVQTVRPVPAPAPAPAQPSQIAYRVQSGDSFSRIASKYGVFGGNGNSLYQYNISSAGRSAQDVATLKSRGPGLIYAGETIYIPR